MTTLTLLKSRTKWVGFCCSGHSGYADAGEDIVCAAISALTQFCISYLEMYKIEHVCNIRENEALIECRVLQYNEAFAKLLTVLKNNTEQLHKQYPKYIQLEIMEVY